MEYVDRLLTKTSYLYLIKELEVLETKRIFCKHGLNHALDTARIMWINSLQCDIIPDKELIYLTALLHDIGRLLEYKKNIPHETAGVQIAKQLLYQINYEVSKTELILLAIKDHRGCVSDEVLKITELLRNADRLSRNCFQCEAKSMCKWEDERMNRTIIV